VKQFGQRMVADHSKANDEPKAAAIQSKITLPGDISKSDQAAYERLSKLSGAEFDKAYAAAMVKDHETDLGRFQKEIAAALIRPAKSLRPKCFPRFNHIFSKLFSRLVCDALNSKDGPFTSLRAEPVGGLGGYPCHGDRLGPQIETTVARCAAPWFPSE
jgi:Domain of unknown function (DUF4142)